MTRLRLLLLATLPAVACALVGLFHPPVLNADSALLWRNLHLALIPIFPLMGLAPWLIARAAAAPRGLRWAAGAGGYVFATMYTSLDILSGVAGGALVAAGSSDVTGPIFAIGRVVSTIGVAGLVVAVLAAGAAAYRCRGVAALPGAVLATAGAALLLPGHIYLGLGTVAVLLYAGGFVILVVVVTRASSSALPEGRSTLPAS